MPPPVTDPAQQALFPDSVTKRPALPVLDSQADIVYIGTRARTMINRPESTGMAFWSINPYIGCAFGCAYCYARYAHGYALERAVDANPDRADLAHDRDTMPPWLAFERRILVKQNAADVVRRTLRFGSNRHLALVNGETLTIGTATDPYQPAERRFRITRSILEALAEHPGLDIWIITKSPLITRDVDVLTRIGRHSTIHVHMSLITVDRDLARRLEPRAPTPDARLRAMRRLRDAGIDVGVNVMPILPGITDAPRQLAAVVRAVADAGVTHLGACALRLQSAARKRYLPFVREEFPALAGRYDATYGNSMTVPDSYREGLRTVMQRLCNKHGIKFGSYSDGARPDDDEHAASAGSSDQLELESSDSKRYQQSSQLVRELEL